VDKLLFSLSQLECQAASWLAAAGDAVGAIRRVEQAVELLAGIERRRSSALANRDRPR
jgi:hypothetical protein